MPPSLQEEGQVLRGLRKEDFRVIRENPLPEVPVHILVGARFDMPKSMRANLK